MQTAAQSFPHWRGLPTVVCVDRAGEGDMSGRLYGPVEEKNGNFSGWMELFGRMEESFDLISFPQKTFEPRTFSGKQKNAASETREREAKMETDFKNSERGEKATFVVQVQFRQNATWQGTVDWMEEKKTRRFRSMLELVRLMDDAVGCVSKDFDGWELAPADEKKEEIE